MWVVGLAATVAIALPGADAAPSDTLIPKEGAPVQTIIDTIQPDGRVRPVGGAAAGWDLATLDRIELGAVRDAKAPPASSYRVAIRGGQSLSGRFAGMEKGLLFLAEMDGATVAMDRSAVASVQQFREARALLQDDFEDGLRRWKGWSGARAAQDRHVSGRMSLAMQVARPGTVTHRLSELAHAGQVTLRFYDDVQVIQGARFFCELEFATPGIAHKVKVQLGWETPTYGVTADPLVNMPVKSLPRRKGWRRMAVDFSSSELIVSVDGVMLAKGPPMGGALSSVRLGTAWGVRRRPGGRPPQGALKPIAYVDDVRILKRSDPFSHRQEDPDLDEVVTTGGDQLMGRLEAMDPRTVTLAGPFGRAQVGWEQIQSVLLRRQHVRPQIMSGWFVRVRRANGDRLAGVLMGVDGQSVRIKTSYAGELKLRRAGVRQIVPVFHGTQWQIDNDYHHLGDSLDEELAVPEPEGHRYQRTFKLPEAPVRPVAVAVTVVQIVGTGSGAAWKDELQQGRLRTYLSVNGQRLASLNDQVPRQSSRPLRLRVPVPAGVLKAGDNTLVIEGTASKDKATGYDDFGFWALALEIDTAAP